MINGGLLVTISWQVETLLTDRESSMSLVFTGGIQIRPSNSLTSAGASLHPSGWLLLRVLAGRAGCLVLAGERASEGRVISRQVHRRQHLAPSGGVGVERRRGRDSDWGALGLRAANEAIERVCELVVVLPVLLCVSAHGMLHVHRVLTNQGPDERVNVISCR